jgi:restriction endonuclease S subunit
MDILYGKLRPNLNKVWLADRTGICSTDIFVIRSKTKKADARFFIEIFGSQPFNARVIQHLKGAQLPRVGWDSFVNLEIPLPPLETQRAIISDLEAERGLVEANRELIALMESKIEAAIKRVWGAVETEQTETALAAE